MDKILEMKLVLEQLKKYPEENADLIDDLAKAIEKDEAAQSKTPSDQFVEAIHALEESNEFLTPEPKVSLADLEEMFSNETSAEASVEEVPSHIHEFSTLEDLKDTITEDGEDFVKPMLLDIEEIAMIAYDTVGQYKAHMFLIHGGSFKDLPLEEQQIVIKRAHEVMHNASNNDDIGIARAQHSQKAMSLLADGYRYGPEVNEEEKISPEVAPWEFLKNEYRMPTMLFRDIVRRLVMSVWSGS